MSLLLELPKIIEDAKTEYERLLSDQSVWDSFAMSEEYGSDGNILGQGDNGKFMVDLMKAKDLLGKLQMVYIDPPFFSRSNYHSVLKIQGEEGPSADADSSKEKPEKVSLKLKQHAYKDTWENGMGEYLRMLCIRLFLIKDLLREDGTVWLHLDWHSVYYVKIFMDEIFGEKNFINEIVWTYKSGGTSKKHFARKHDTIIVYGKSPKYYLDLPFEKSYNRGLKPYRFKGVKEYEDDHGWYTMVRMKDVWSIDMVGRTSSERTGYATQKPEALLERIIAASTRKGDVCGDFFCGSGTMAAVATGMERKWVCCDNSQPAAMITLKRVLGKGGNCCFEIEKETLKNFPDALRRADKESEFAAVNGAITCENRITLSYEKMLHGNILLSIEDFKPSLGEEYEKNVADQNPLALVGYWAVDLDYKGGIFKPDVWECREGSTLNTSMDLDTCEHSIGQRTLVKVVDILGNVYFEEIHIAL